MPIRAPSVLDIICNCKKKILLKILFWSLLVIGLAQFVWGFVAVAVAVNYYPKNSNIFTAVAIGIFGFTITFTLLPMSNLLITYKKRWLHVLYIVCCALFLIMPILGILMLESYTEAGFVRDEYIRHTQDAFDSSTKSIPGWVGHSSKNEEESCCGYFGPYDIGETFKLTQKQLESEEFRQSVREKCFSSKVVNGRSVYTLPKGCQTRIKKKVKMIAEILFINYIITITLTLLTIAIHTGYCSQIVSGSSDYDQGRSGGPRASSFFVYIDGSTGEIIPPKPRKRRKKVTRESITGEIAPAPDPPIKRRKTRKKRKRSSKRNKKKRTRGDSELEDDDLQPEEEVDARPP